jgi:predicted DNA-binding transcriptional regulator YafY
MGHNLGTVHDDPTARALALLAAFTARPRWSGDELAHRLGVTTRTVRRDVERLRRLGYDIEGAAGVEGGYRLRSGDAVPPLFLEADEAVAVVTALVTASSDRRSGMVDASSRALAKLHHVLPLAVRPGVEAVRSTVRAASTGTDAAIDPLRLSVLAEACRDEVAVAFDYAARGAASTRRRVEPHALVTVQRNWYLLGFDLDRDDWRIFRLDRLTGDVAVTGHGITRRSVPGGDPLAYVVGAAGEVRHAHHAEVEVDLSASAALGRLAWLSHRRITEVGPGSCRVRLDAPDAAGLTRQLADVCAVLPVVTARVDEATAEHVERLAALVTVGDRR